MRWIVTLKNSKMIDVKFPIKVKDLAKVVDQANLNPSTMDDNKLIAEFMGMEKERHADGRYLFTNDLEEAKGTDTRFTEELYFHLSWDWLMPVVRKCKNVDADWINENAQHLIDDIDNALTCCWSEESTCKVVVEFIKEYNLKS
jgi:hypothetical protein